LNGDGDIPALLDRTFCGQWMHLFYADARSRAPENPAVQSHVSRNGFWFPEGKRFDDPLTDAVLDALFDPICRDYQSVADTVSDLAAGEQFIARELVRRIPGAFYPDVEGALDDLVERGVLECKDDKYWSKESHPNLEDYRNACAWESSARRHRMVS
jgi:hypothetical protein